MFETHTVMLDPGDHILTENVESLMAKQQVGYPGGITPQQYAYAEEVTRQNFYLDAVPRVPRVIQYIFESDLDTDKTAAGLEYGIKNLLVYDPNFLVSLMTYLAQPTINPNGIAAVGAFMVKIMTEYADKLKEAADTKKDKDKTEKVEKDEEAEGIERISKNVGTLLRNVVEIVDINCPGLTETEKLATAAAIAMQNHQTLGILLQNDLPVTANLIDIIRNSGNNKGMNLVIASAFLLEKKDFPKLTENQEKFIDSLSTYVFKLINEKGPTEICALFGWIYGSYDCRNVDLEKYIIDPRACGTQYSRLHATIKTMFPAKKK
jgi:hypothetical protein